ncbi:CPBP family intramembrane metalloprotease [Halomicrobium sp. IBSBa]|uniref:CPBP family intramembrane metalloprotease n=1 Tax=Halomicrobium mukohataei TaxID=57705 RepID=A0A847UE82_9EURY|nr:MULTISPECIES: type II CAAX endopeptidase family protein [Halomicrobium]MBO4247878.1 CPBP family intramembrane metalloprotease [Halomicrobium sp. IBSBa]NLV09398.1 CPBP family intramembrane metalloprotease [Halomicrobium mukohataei]
MARSDLIMDVRRVLVNPQERRLRAGWRLLVGLPVLLFVLAVAGVGQRALQAAPLTVPVLAGGAVLAGALLSYGAGTGTLIGLSWWLGGRTLAGLGLGGDGWWRNLGFGLLVGVAMTTTIFLVELSLGLIAVDGVLVARQPNQLGVALPALVAVPVTLLFFVGVGVFEEVLTRGYLLNNVAEGLSGVGPIGKRGAIAVAAALTSAVFGLLHLTNPSTTLFSTLNITVVGLFFAATYVVTDDLGIPIGIHITWNFSLSSLYGFPVSGLAMPGTVLSVRQTGADVVTGGTFGPEGGLILYLGLAVGIALTWWWVRRVDGPVRFRTDIADPDLRDPPRPE